MPSVFEWSGYKFFFFSNEGIPREPCHIHVRKGEKAAKFWVTPYISLKKSYQISAKDLLMLQKVIVDRCDLIRRRWDEHFSN